VPAAARLAPGPAARSAQRPAGRHAPPSAMPPRSCNERLQGPRYRL